MELIEGWINYIKKTEIPKDYIDAVEKCPHRIKAPISALSLKDDNPIISGMICEKCWCPLPTKLRVKNCCNGNKED